MCVLCLALLLPFSPARAQTRSEHNPTATPVRVTLTTCGPLTPAKNAAPPGISPENGPLSPTDQGFGCDFAMEGGASDAAVLLEARLTRPSLVGTEHAVDRWFVPARPHMSGTVRHVFALPEEATPGTWDLSLYLDGRLLAGHRFTIAAAPPKQTGPTTAPAAIAGPRKSSARSRPGMAARLKQDQNEMPPIPGTPPATQAPVTPPGPRQGETTAARHPPVPETPPKQRAAPPEPHAIRERVHALLTVPPAPPAAPVPAPTSAASAKPPAATGYFALQTGLFADPANADTQAAHLRSRGIPACIAEETTTSGKRYRVLAGRFGDRRSATILRQEVTDAVGGRALVRQVSPEMAAHLRCQ